MQTEYAPERCDTEPRNPPLPSKSELFLPSSESRGQNINYSNTKKKNKKPQNERTKTENKSPALN